MEESGQEQFVCREFSFERLEFELLGLKRAACRESDWRPFLYEWSELTGTGNLPVEVCGGFWYGGRLRLDLIAVYESVSLILSKKQLNSS